MTIPLQMSGAISHIPTRKPTQEEMEEFQSLDPGSSIDLMSNMEWEPYSPQFKSSKDLLVTEARMMATVEREPKWTRDRESLLSC
jgi:hypothetical protein